MQDDTSHYEGALLEEIRDQNKAILEGLQPMPQLVQDVHQLKEDVSEIKTDIKVIKSVAKDQSRALKDHEERITTLEPA